ncbi:hypothetical protein [Streptomyces platensis]|uniref:hypothetical protein n=1 Tax=Streptomyces platensis TaxID=58346 RepID=UPI001F2369CC|nr:hypothetical protein [Streptomyces platensis]MCF3143680.1 hypothetical protein [Streptomyces platensis]
MDTQIHPHTFTALAACFSADLATFIAEDAPQDPSPADFIDLIDRVQNVLGSASLGNLQEAEEELDAATTYLTDALNRAEDDRATLLAHARTHLRNAIEAIN